MVKPVFRRKSSGTKVSEEEYQLAEWVREVPPRERANRRGRQARPAERTLLVELLALRTILLNLHFTLAKGEAITAEDM